MQVINVQDPRDSGLIYDPRWKELRIVSGIALVLNKKTMQFEVDRTPSEDEELVPVRGMSVAPDASSMSFGAEHDGEQIQFSVASRYRFDHVLYAAIARLQARSFSFDAGDEDSVSVLCKNGSLCSLVVRKAQDPSGPYLHVSFGSVGIFRIIENPHARLPVSDLKCEDRSLMVTVDGREHAYQFASQDFIVTLVRDLLACRH